MADSKPQMSAGQEKTGHKLELGDATTKMAEAVVTGDPVLMRAAADAHATALNSQATAMAASIAAPVYTQLGEIATSVKQLAEIVSNARNADLTWRTEERIRREKQSDRLYDELDRLANAAQESSARLGKFADDLDGLRQGQRDYNTRLDAVITRIDADEERLDNKRIIIAEHDHRLHRLEENNARLELLETEARASRSFREAIQARIERSLSEDEVREFTVLLRQIAAERGG